VLPRVFFYDSLSIFISGLVKIINCSSGTSSFSCEETKVPALLQLFPQFKYLFLSRGETLVLLHAPLIRCLILFFLSVKTLSLAGDGVVCFRVGVRDLGHLFSFVADFSKKGQEDEKEKKRKPALGWLAVFFVCVKVYG